MYIPPCWGNCRERADTVTAQSTKKNSAAPTHRIIEPAPACAAAATHLRLTMAQTSKKTTSFRVSSRRSVAFLVSPDFSLSANLGLRIVSSALNDDLIKCRQQVFACRIRARNIGARLDTQLGKLDDAPVLAVCGIPKLNSVVAHKVPL